jgi:hypothetical protein
MNGISRLHRGRRRRGAASIEEALALADALEILEQVSRPAAAPSSSATGPARGATSTARSSWPAIAARSACSRDARPARESIALWERGWPTRRRRRRGRAARRRHRRRERRALP